MTWADYYTQGAAAYRRFRPEYPRALFAHLARIVPHRDRAWDCATGNGQAAKELATFFRVVVATDASVPQLAYAERGATVLLTACLAQATALGARSVDLVTVAQALHWFADEPFFQEVRRVARHGAIIATWSYGLLRVNSTVDAVLQRFHREEVGRFWPAERRHVDSAYRRLKFPFAEIPSPGFTMTASWTLEHLLGYIRTWSAVKRATVATGRDPVTELSGELQRTWGAPNAKRTMTWPVHLRVGQVHRAPRGVK